MSMEARERAILDATAIEFEQTAPALAGFLADGPELLRIRGIPPKAIDGLVPGWRPPPRRKRLWRALRPGTPRYMHPPQPGS